MYFDTPLVACSPLIERMPDGRPVRFGVELEGFHDLTDLALAAKIPLTDEGLNDYVLKYQGRTRFAAQLQRRVRPLKVQIDDCFSETAWTIDGDSTILPDDPCYCDIEIRSPILSGAKGLKNVGAVFSAAKAEDLRTNASCGLHVHVSLGWPRYNRLIDPCHPDFPPMTQSAQEIKNIYTAYYRHQSFFNELIAPERVDAPYCRCNTVAPETLDVFDLPSFYTKMRREKQQFTAHPIASKGTVEWRLCQADHYTEALHFIRFIVSFTAKAALDPNLDPQILATQLFRPKQAPDLPRFNPQRKDNPAARL